MEEHEAKKLNYTTPPSDKEALNSDSEKIKKLIGCVIAVRMPVPEDNRKYCQVPSEPEDPSPNTSPKKSK